MGVLLLVGCAAAGQGSPPAGSVADDVPGAVGSSSARPTLTADAGKARRAPSQVVPERPATVRLPSGAVLAVDPARTGAGGVLQIPESVARAGWWVGSSRLGDPFGSMVMAAHVDSVEQGLGPVAELLSARPGDRVRVAGRRLARWYRIDSVHSVPRVSLAHESALFATAGSARLVMITCSGPFGEEWDGYRDNLIVEAVPAGRITSAD